TLARVGMLVNAGSVKTGQTMGISGEVGGNPVQDHADALLMHIIHKVHKIIRRSVAAGRRVIAGYLITPGGVKGMLHNGEQLYMSIPHLLYILCQSYSNLPVIIKFGAYQIAAVFIYCRRLADSGS